jgi:hypothetical protein
MNERRKHCRVAGLMVSGITVRVRPACDGTLLNLSRGGALIELRRPMPPGVYVDVQLCGASRVLVRALVLRCSVGAIAALEGVMYRTALLFDQEHDLEGEAETRDGYSVPAERDAPALVTVSGLPEVGGASSAVRLESSK